MSAPCPLDPFDSLGADHLYDPVLKMRLGMDVGGQLRHLFLREVHKEAFRDYHGERRLSVEFAKQALSKRRLCQVQSNDIERATGLFSCEGGLFDIDNFWQVDFYPSQVPWQLQTIGA